MERGDLLRVGKDNLPEDKALASLAGFSFFGPFSSGEPDSLFRLGDGDLEVDIHDFPANVAKDSGTFLDFSGFGFNGVGNESAGSS